MTAFSVSMYPDTSFDSNTMGRDYLAAAAAALPTFLRELTFAYEYADLGNDELEEVLHTIQRT